MEEKQQKTQQSIIIITSDQELQEEQLQFNNKQGTCPPIILYFLLFLIVASLIFIFFKIATLNQNERINIVIPPWQQSYSAENRTNTSIFYDDYISPEIILEQLADNYIEIKIDDQQHEDVIKAQKLNQFHVQYNKALRNIDYTNAKMQFSDLLQQQISKDTPIKYSQFLQALGLLQLTTLPVIDLTQQSSVLTTLQLNYYKNKWKIIQNQPPICAILILTTQGMNSGSYYYSIRSLFQQNYKNYKVVIIENKPQLGIDSNIRGLLKQVSQGRAVILDRVKGSQNQGSAVFYALHNHCKQSEYSIILRDNGQVIGKQAFSILNTAHQTKKTGIVFSHYLLDSENVFTNLPKDDFRYRIQLYPEYKNSSNPREQVYKTKYIQSYQTQLLLSLPLSVFKTIKGEWYSQSFEASLEFSVLEKSCGNYYLLPQILYRLPKSAIQKSSIINDARIHRKLTCTQNKQLLIYEQSSIPFSFEFKRFEKNLIEIQKIGNLTKDEQIKIDKRLVIFNNNRISSLKAEIKKKQQKLSFSNQKQYIQDHNVSLKEQIQVLKLMIESRVNIYQNSDTISLGNQQENFIEQQSKLKNNTHSNNYQVAKLTSKLTMGLPHQQSTFFCILLLTQNNEANFDYFYSIQSVLKQVYSNYRLAILDNASSDNTIKLLKRHLYKFDTFVRKRVRIFSSHEAHPQGEHLYFGVRKFCSSNQVVIIMKEGQELIGNYVLKKLNKEYRETNSLAIHTGNILFQDKNFKFNSAGTYQKSIIQKRSFRQHKLLFNSLRTFKVNLFVSIVESDFKKKGVWSNSDLQFYISYAILEMACTKIKYLKEVLYKIKNPPKDFPYSYQQSDPSSFKSLQPHYQCLQENYLQANP